MIQSTLPVNLEPISTDAIVLPTDSISTFNHFVHTNPDVVYSYMLRKLKRAVHKNIDALELFRLGKSNTVMRIEKAEYEKYLTEMQSYFVKHEKFENAGVCAKVLDEHRINLLIEST